MRWLVLVLGVAVAVQRVLDWRGRAAPRRSALHRAFIHALDVQLLLGFLLYVVLSPLPRGGFANLGATLGDSTMRFFTIEHAFGMLVAVVLAHVGYALLRKETPRALGWALGLQLAWLLVTLVSIPWPGLPYARPLFRVP